MIAGTTFATTMDLHLTDEQAELDRLIENDRYPLPARPSELDLGYRRRQLFTSEKREARRHLCHPSKEPPLTTIVLEHDNG